MCNLTLLDTERGHIGPGFIWVEIIWEKTILVETIQIEMIWLAKIWVKTIWQRQIWWRQFLWRHFGLIHFWQWTFKWDILGNVVEQCLVETSWVNKKTNNNSNPLFWARKIVSRYPSCLQIYLFICKHYQRLVHIPKFFEDVEFRLIQMALKGPQRVLNRR